MKKKSQKSKRKKSSLSLDKIIIFSLIILIFLLGGFIGGFLYNEKKSSKEIKKYQNTLTLLEQKVEKLSKEIKKTNPETTKHNVKNTEIIDLMTQPAQMIKPSHNNIISKKINTKKPKLVIIIDDVAFKYEVNLIKQIPYKITPSFFPPTKSHPFTPVYAKEFPDYMVHVPMEAFNFAHPEPDTLQADSSYLTIKNRIDSIKKMFPNVKFINNHTGSKFTSTLSAMDYLFEALKKDRLGFVDSKTTPLSKSKEAEKIYKIPLFCRDIFLDNEENPEYIKKQLKKAVIIAKRRGYAIAIGHPHKITLQTIKNSKNLLKQVDVIYIDELAKYAKN